MTELSKYTVLVVDDEDTLRKTIVFDFKRKGFVTLGSSNGNDALELVKTNKVDLVVSDIRMPGGDGITLLERIRAHDPKVPTVILVTGFADISEEECLKKGAYQVLAKPFDRKTLMNAALAALGLPTQ